MSDRSLGESDWEDQDLLTLDEAGERLEEELAAATAERDEALAAGDDARAERLEARVRAVSEALDRIRGLSGG